MERFTDELIVWLIAMAIVAALLYFAWPLFAAAFMLFCAFAAIMLAFLLVIAAKRICQRWLFGHPGQTRSA